MDDLIKVLYKIGFGKSYRQVKYPIRYKNLFEYFYNVGYAYDEYCINSVYIVRFQEFMKMADVGLYDTRR